MLLLKHDAHSLRYHPRVRVGRGTLQTTQTARCSGAARLTSDAPVLAALAAALSEPFAAVASRPSAARHPYLTEHNLRGHADRRDALGLGRRGGKQGGLRCERW